MATQWNDVSRRARETAEQSYELTPLESRVERMLDILERRYPPSLKPQSPICICLYRLLPSEQCGIHFGLMLPENTEGPLYYTEVYMTYDTHCSWEQVRCKVCPTHGFEKVTT